MTRITIAPKRAKTFERLVWLSNGVMADEADALALHEAIEGKLRVEMNRGTCDYTARPFMRRQLHLRKGSDLF